MPHGPLNLPLRFLPAALVVMVALTGCVHPVKPIGSALRVDTDSVVRGADCRTVRLNKIQFDWTRDRSRSLPCLELEDAVYYIRVGGQSHLLIDVIPNVLVKEQRSRSVVWTHAVTAVYEHISGLSLDTAHLFGHDASSSLLFLQSVAGVSIIRQSDGAFLLYIDRFYHHDLQTPDIDLCSMNGALAIGLFVKKGGGVEEQEWFVLPEALLKGPKR